MRETGRSLKYERLRRGGEEETAVAKQRQRPSSRRLTGEGNALGLVLIHSSRRSRYMSAAATLQA